VANVSQVLTLEKQELDERLGAVDRSTLRRIESGLRSVLGL